MPEQPPAGAHLIRVSSDAASEWPAGVAPLVRWVDPARVAVGDVAAGVQNWDYYDGALVAVGFSDGTTFTVSGSGVMVAPGLVLTATHVIDEQVDALEAKTLSLWCVGVRLDGRADLWTLRTLRYPETDSDIAFLGVEPYSDLPDRWALTCLPLSTRAPEEGEALTVIGFRFDGADGSDELPPINDIGVIGRGQLYAGTGRVEAVHYPYRDQVMAPFPTIEIACGSLGGMSGGAVLDRDGAVVGILSTGLSHDDGRGPSNAAWIIHALMFTVTLLWPPALYRPDTPMIDLPHDLLRILGRERVRLTGTNELEYTAWR